MKLILFILSLSIFVSCSDKKDSKNIDSISNDSKANTVRLVVVDTMTSFFPVQIGNDKGTVKVSNFRTHHNEKLTSNNFNISLRDIASYPFSKQIDKSILIDLAETESYQDSIKSDYLKSATIKDIRFEGVRSNTLTFSTILENQIANKEIHGRFSLFYRTKKKGTVYGWFADEIKGILPKTK